MVKIKHPKGRWVVKEERFNDNCPYLIYPADYVGCSHKDRREDEIKECKQQKCPIFFRTEFF